MSQRAFYLFGHHFLHDPVYFFGLAFAIFIAASVAYNSPFRPDRFVFGAVATSFATALVREFAPLTRFSLAALNAADALAWTLGAAVCLAVIAGRVKAEQGNGPGLSVGS
jgi:hypothetical protein